MEEEEEEDDDNEDRSMLLFTFLVAPAKTRLSIEMPTYS
jgi:hypothetical protein